jgi:hypothetical protein
MKEEFPSLAENADIKTLRSVERTRLGAVRQVYRSTLSGVRACGRSSENNPLDEQSALGEGTFTFNC